MISDCWELKGSPKSDDKNPAGFISQWRKQKDHTNDRNHNVIADRFGNQNVKCNDSSDSGVVNCSLPAEFTPFVLEGSVSKETDGKSAKTVKILQGTGCMQSLILTSALPSGDTSTGEDVLISGIFGSNRVPLHKFYLKSDLITGFVELGAIDQLPFMLLGNDLAGDKVKPSGCIVVDKTQEDVTDNLGLDETLTSCVVTRAMKKKLSDNDKNESVLDTNNNSKTLADTFMSHDVDSTVSCNDNVVESPVNGRQLRLDQKKDTKLASLTKTL